MRDIKKTSLSFLLIFSLIVSFAATTVSGTVKDEANEPIIGANVSIKGTTEGTVTDLDGNFELTTEQEPPFTLVVSMVGMSDQEQEITGNASDLAFTLAEESSELNTVVVSASRVEEKILESPVTIEKMDQKAIKLSSSSDYYDDLSKLKGVQTISGSMTFTAVNTRGFGGISNTRFVQLMDGMDNAAPLLNFPTGNIVGIGELDIANVELVPGAASALYGPNAFNGILLMNSKNPFDYPGFSAQVKGGFAQASNNYGYKPLGSVGMRVGHVWNRKEKEFVAIKVNFNAFKGTDWYANDYNTPRNNSGALGTQGFDGMNTYGDEANIFELSPLALPGTIAGAQAGTNGIVGGINNIKNQVKAGVRAGAYAQAYQAAINGGATPAQADAIANTQADAYVDSPAGQAQINAVVQQQVAANIPVPISDPNYTAGIDVAAAFDSIQPLFDQLLANGLRRTGLQEQYLLDNNNATSIKGDFGVYLRPFQDKNYEFSYNYRIGYGNSVYQGSERYALRNFTQQFHKAEIKGQDFFVRSYMSQTNAGDSYNNTALGSYVNEASSSTSDVWAPTYLGTLANTIVGTLVNTPAAALLANNGALFNQLAQNARNVADEPWTSLSAEEQQAIVEQVRSGLFQQGGASFIDNSRLFHTEAMVDLSRWTGKYIDIQVGGNHRMYSLYTNGTVFNEDPDGDGVFERININEFGAFLQLQRKLFDDMLRLQASIRYDKNENFKGIWSPRVAAVLSFGEDRNHNIRMSYQTGFRNPDTQAQYIYFPTTSRLLGGTEANASRYGIYNGGAYTYGSYQEYILGGNDSSKLQTANLSYVKPERLQVVELGYKALVANKKLMIDVNGYFNIYNDFIGQTFVVNKDSTSHKGEVIEPGELWYPYTNLADKVYSYGAGIGVMYALPKRLYVRASYNYTDFKLKDANTSGSTEQDLGFNTAQHQMNVGLSGEKVWKGLGFAIDYRWQSEINWASSFANGIVDSRGVLDANINYFFDKIQTQLKVGATNIAGPDYRTNVGGPFIGRTFYVGLTYNQGKNWLENSQRINTPVAY